MKNPISSVHNIWRCKRDLNLYFNFLLSIKYIHTALYVWMWKSLFNFILNKTVNIYEPSYLIWIFQILFKFIRETFRQSLTYYYIKQSIYGKSLDYILSTLICYVDFSFSAYNTFEDTLNCKLKYTKLIIINWTLFF